MNTGSDNSVSPHTARPLSLTPGVGNTPLIPLDVLGREVPHGVTLYGKCEHLQRGGSAKARPACYMITHLLQQGHYRHPQEILIPGSGNTGLACAAEGAQRGLPITLVMANDASPERIRLAHHLGARVILTPASQGSDGAYRHAVALCTADPERYYLLDQYCEAANWLAHYETTGPEIWQQTNNQITHLIAGIGTGGTIVGAGRALKGHRREITVVAAEPAGPHEAIPGLRHLGSAMVPQIFDRTVIDDFVPVHAHDALNLATFCAQHQGLAVGPSSGAALWAALTIAARLKSGCLVVILPDGIEKYTTMLTDKH